jgi:hypothetical protein
VAQAAQQGPAEQSFTRPYLARYRDEPLSFLNPIQEVSESFLMGLAEEEEARVWGDAKGFFFKAKEGTIHERGPHLRRLWSHP